MISEIEHTRKRLIEILTEDKLLAQVFPFTGDLESAKLSRARLLMKNAADNSVDLNQALEAAIGIEMVHLATLIHDDVIDDSDLRRNQDSFRAAKGDKGAVLYGDYLFSSAIQQIISTQNQECASAFVESINNTCRGEAIQDLFLTSEEFSPTIEDMHDVARGKTGALFAFCTLGPACVKGTISELGKSTLKEIGYLLGLAYQLTDDVMDILGVEENLGKPAGNDLNKNCMTTPLYMLMQEYELEWRDLRKRYTEGNADIKSDFIASHSFEQVKTQITDIKKDLDDKVEICRNENWQIGEIVELFWSLYVEKRIEFYEKASFTQI